MVTGTGRWRTDRAARRGDIPRPLHIADHPGARRCPLQEDLPAFAAYRIVEQAVPERGDARCRRRLRALVHLDVVLLGWLPAIGLPTVALLLATHLFVLCADRRELWRLAEGPMWGFCWPTAWPSAWRPGNCGDASADPASRPEPHQTKSTGFWPRANGFRPTGGYSAD